MQCWVNYAKCRAVFYAKIVKKYLASLASLTSLTYFIIMTVTNIFTYEKRGVCKYPFFSSLSYKSRYLFKVEI